MMYFTNGSNCLNAIPDAVRNSGHHWSMKLVPLSCLRIFELTKRQLFDLVLQLRILFQSWGVYMYKKKICICSILH